jgi:hypothetical protein
MNKLLIKTFMGVLLLFLAATAAAEEPVAQDKSICEAGEHFSDFDFWVGEWNVYSNDAEKTFQGTNSITRHHKNCLLMENWTSAQGGNGSSMNYYDPVTDQWRQLWVAGGYSIDYSGGLDDRGSMVLKGKINYYETGQSYKFRGTWTPGPDGGVRQIFEQHDPESDTWSIWFDGLYVRR